MAKDLPKRLTAQEAKDKVTECLHLAKLATKQEHRIMLEHMAETWQRIAQEVGAEN